MKLVYILSFILAVQLCLSLNVVISGQREDRVSKGRMSTQFTLYDDGSITSTTDTWSESKWSGFTGSVFIVFFGENSQILWTTSMHKYGVNGKWIPGGPDKRTDQWSEHIPVDLIGQIDKASIVHKHTPTDRVVDFLEDNKELIAKILEQAFSKEEEEEEVDNDNDGFLYAFAQNNF